MKPPRIQIEGLVARRGDFVLRDVDLQVADGEIFAILGQTGSGKTVLLEALAGAFEPEEGVVRIDGVDARRVAVQDRHMGIVYQDNALFPHLTVFENVAYGLRRRRIEKAEVSRRVREMLELFGIGHLADRYPGVISGGESQRTALARALVLRPRTLLLDEPFSALDPATKERMYGTVRSIHRDFGCTIVFVTHDFEEARTLADRIGIILGGTMRAVVDAAKLFDGDYDEDVRYFLGM